MPAKPYCLLPANFAGAQLETLNCGAGTHLHLSHAELREFRDLRLIETEDDSAGQPHVVWLRAPNQRERIRGVVRLARRLGLRGLSCLVGEDLAAAVRSRQAWALTMLDEIRQRVDRPS